MCLVSPEVLAQNETAKVELTLVKATAIDLKVLLHNKEIAPGVFEPVFGLRENLPFWLKSKETNKVEDYIYFNTKERNQLEVKHWLDEGRIYIHADHAAEL